MNSRITRSILVVLAGVLVPFRTSQAAFDVKTVPVGSPGNAPDLDYGAVPYNYRIGTFDVTNAQYVAFLNAKATAADPYGLWSSSMDPTTHLEGAISRSGLVPYSYTVRLGYSNKPVDYVSWYDAIRFVNWLQNGQGNGNTEAGTYTITGGGINSGTVLVPSVVTRALWAQTNSFHWVLPSENEWYKAAYYNAGNNSYYFYPFRSNTQPVGIAPPGNVDSGDFSTSAYNYDGFGSFLSDVGAYPNSISPFGSFDMGGNVDQWNEAPIGSSRGVRGGDFVGPPSSSLANFRNQLNPSLEDDYVGFRIASIGSAPEPPSNILMLVALLSLLTFYRRLLAGLRGKMISSASPLKA